MSALTKMLTGAAGLAAVTGFASPASAQYYPNQNYGYGYPNQSGGVVGQIINGVLGGGQYGYGGYNQGFDRYAVDQCARAVVARLNYNDRDGRYGNYGGGYGYNNTYGRARVQSITRVERKSYGLKVHGMASSGAGLGYGAYPGRNQGYGYAQPYGAADVRFNCKVDRRGRVTDVDLDRTNVGYYRGY